MDVKIKLLDENAKVPTYATDGSGCFDLFPSHQTTSIHYNTPVVFQTGLAFEIPEDHVMLIFSRSGHGFKSATRLSNCVGVIDHDYRGEVMVKLNRDAPGVTQQKPGEAIAQALVIKREKVNFVIVDELSETDRGAGGFGHTTK